MCGVVVFVVLLCLRVAVFAASLCLRHRCFVVSLCLRVLYLKPWHFGAASGIVMCYAKLAEASNSINRGKFIEEANKWAAEAMPQPGKNREVWCERMLGLMDAKLAELEEIAEG